MFSDEEACPHDRHGPRSELQIATRLCCRSSLNNLNATRDTHHVSQRHLGSRGDDGGCEVDLLSRILKKDIKRIRASHDDN